MAKTLSPSQSAALLDILTHHDTYAEIRDFRYPGSLKQYGPPFNTESGRSSSSPALQALVSKFALTLPGLRELTDGPFWKVQVNELIEGLERANLSESYDKGVIGSRKTLATAVSALIEYPVRGVYGGFPKFDRPREAYDLKNAEDLNRAFRDSLNEAVYGSLLEDLVKRAAETDNLEEHSPIVKALHEYVLVNLASFMHYTLILSPKGQYLLKLIDHANKLVPYMVIRQTLKIGNVASMVNAMTKLVLAKMSVASLTNWIGITQSKDEGMNLLQTIISTVLNWDIKDLESRAQKLERERAQLGKDQLHSLKEYTTKPRDEQARIRKQSQTESISIVTSILRNTELESRLTEPHHKNALEYLNIQLSIRDRREIIQILCRNHPDHLTQSIRDLVAAYEPVIRGMHNAIDLSGTISDFESFVKDMIKLAKVRTTSKDSQEASVPSVGDFVQLLRKHQKSSHTFIHQACKNGPELTSWYIDWGKKAASEFKQQEQSDNAPPSNYPSRTAGDLVQPLNDLFMSLPEETQAQILPILDAHTQFLDSMHQASRDRLNAVLHSAPSRNPIITKILSTGTSSASTSRPPSPGPPSSTSNSNNGPAATLLKPSSTSTFLSPPPPSSSSSSPSPTSSASFTTTTAVSSLTTPSPSTPAPAPGPGSFLTRWQDLLDSSATTPVTQPWLAAAPTDHDPRLDCEKQTLATTQRERGEGDGDGEKTKTTIKPDATIVIESLADRFRDVLGERGCWW